MKLFTDSRLAKKYAKALNGNVSLHLKVSNSPKRFFSKARSNAGAGSTGTIYTKSADEMQKIIDRYCKGKKFKKEGQLLKLYVSGLPLSQLVRRCTG